MTSEERANMAAELEKKDPKELTLDERRIIVDAEGYNIKSLIKDDLIESLRYYNNAIKKNTLGQEDYVSVGAINKLYRMAEEYLKVFEEINEKVINNMEREKATNLAKSKVPRRTRLGDNPIPERKNFFTKQ